MCIVKSIFCHRRGENKLNFLGGKRRILNCTAAEVAVARLQIETGNQLLDTTIEAMLDCSNGDDHTFPFVHWGAGSKYALFLWELTDPVDLAVDELSKGAGRKESIEWISRKSLLK